MKEEIICAGFGGQGIMLLGKLIALGAMHKGLKVTWMPSYGAEVRGGTAHSMVVVSDDDIASPVVSLCDTLIAMNKPSFDRFLPKVRPRGTVIVNTSFVDAPSAQAGVTVIGVPLTAIANSLGSVRVANVIALGVYMKKKRLFSKEILIDEIENLFDEKMELVKLNIMALEEGLKIR